MGTDDSFAFVGRLCPEKSSMARAGFNPTAPFFRLDICIQHREYLRVDHHGACLPFDEIVPQIYRNALHAELAEMRESRKTHAIDLLKARVASARAVTAESR